MAISEEKIGRGLAKLARTLQAWQLSADGDFFLSGNSLLQPVLYRRQPAMLKIPLSKKGEAGFRLLACWAGKASVNVYQYDADALLMERAVGRRSLRRMVLDDREDEANTIICGVVRQLHAHPCVDTLELAPLASWFRSLAVAATKQSGAFATCHEIADELLRDPLDILALHGDIHYDNILDSGREGDVQSDKILDLGDRGWVAIDPKGVIGERGFDYANLFCNPTLEVATSPTRLHHQVPLIAARAGLEPSRLLRWIIAWSGLMAAWMLEDGEQPTLPLQVAQLALKELGIS